jgi:chromosome segregation ATPase
MDTIFIWILAAATIGLLGTFLIASERELKNKRQELDTLKNKPAAAPASESSSDATAADPKENEPTAEILATNQVLVQQVSDLEAKLEASESHKTELQALRGHLTGMELENDDLRSHRESLQAELARLRSQLESNAPRRGEPSGHPEIEAKIADLEEQLQASQAKIRDLENTRAQLESRQIALEESRSHQEADNIRLQNELAAERENHNLLEATQLRLSRIEQRHQELSEAHFQLQHENSELRNQNESLWGELRERVEQLRLEQAEIADKNRLVQEEILAMGNLLEALPGTTSSPEPTGPTDYDRNGFLDPTEERSSDAVNGTSSAENHHNEAQSIAPARETDSESLSSGPTSKKRRFGIFSAD